MTDILLNLRTGVVLDDVEMEVVFDPVEIRKYYMKSWFFIGTVQREYSSIRDPRIETSQSLA